MQMKIKYIEKQIYVAKDGREFDDPRDCASYEWEQFDATKVYVISHTDYSTLRRDRRYDDVEIYSSKEKAQQAIDSYHDSEDWEVRTIFLDERIEKHQILENLKDIV